MRQNDDPLYCNWHLRYHAYKTKSDRYKRGEYRGSERRKAMPRFYRTRVTKTVQELLEEHLNAPAHEQVQLLEELALSRDAAGEAVALYCIVKEMAPGPKRDEMMISAVELMKGQLDYVKSMALAANNILQSGKNGVGVNDLSCVIEQMVRAAYDSFGDVPEAKEFERKLREQIKVPLANGVAGTEGTSLTPDQDAMDMDATVPARPEDE